MAADYTHGDACAAAGAFHQTNDAGGMDFLICDGSNWKSVLFFSSAGNNLRIDNDPAAGSAGCIQYDGTGGKLQFSHDCTTYADFGSSAGSGLWTTGTGNDIYYNSGTPQVGIGLTNPAYALDISGSIQLTSSLIIGGTGGASTPSFFNLDDLGDVDTTGVSGGEVLLYSGSNWIAGSGGGGSPGGNNTEIQFNSSGAFDGDPDLTWNTATNTMTTINIDYTGYITDVSDKRLKENIVPLENSLGGILALQGYRFTMKGDQGGKIEYGVMAQDVQSVFPELVNTRQDGMLTMNYIGLIAPLIETVKVQQDEIENLNERLKALEARYGTGFDNPQQETGEQ